MACSGMAAAYEALDSVAAKGALYAIEADDVVLQPEAVAEINTGPWASQIDTDKLTAKPLHARGGRKCAEKLATRLWRGLEALAATELWSRMPTRHRKEALLQAGGEGTGSFWTTVPGADGRMDDPHWRIAWQERLGILRVPQGTRCCLRTADAGERCGKLLDSEGRHPHTCAAGPHKLRPHRSVIAKLAQCLQPPGASVDTERSIPQLYEWSGGRCLGHHGHRGPMAREAACPPPRCHYQVAVRIQVSAVCCTCRGRGR